MAGLIAAIVWVGAAVAADPEPEATPEAERKPLTVVVTDDLEIRYRVEPARVPGFEDRPVFNYVEQVDRLNVLIGRERWSLFAQIDQVALFANRYVLDDVLTWERELVAPDAYTFMPGDSYLNPEKLSFSYGNGDTTVKLGDFYAAFGRGVALNLSRNVDIDIDTSIQGAYLLQRSGAWDVVVLVGQLNRQQVFQDNPNLGIRGDFRHFVTGARVERFGLGPANVGAHGVLYSFAPDPGWGAGFREVGTTPDAVIGGATVELLGLGGLDWFVEADAFGYPSGDLLADDDAPVGYAAYAASTAYVGKTTWQLEGKRYAGAERLNAALAPELYEVAIAPTLEYERAITEDSSATVNSNDVWGGRLRVDWTAKPGEAIPYASVAVFRDLELGGLHFNRRPETVLHGLLGAEVFTDDVTVLVNSGYRYDRRDGNGGADRQLHGDIDLKLPIVAELDVDLAVAAEHFWWGRNALQQSDYTEVESALTFGWGGKVSLTWFTDYTDNPLVASTGNLADSVYGAAELQVKPLPALTVKAFYGAYKAGIRCSGGQCRQLPGFEGARLAVVGTFQ